ncbi:MAG: hypothetical protein HQL31_02630, partial [Planctomycetes bacterium]|nr:hypothetical protein [Planctomycetota bacterium]
LQRLDDTTRRQILLRVRSRHDPAAMEGNNRIEIRIGAIKLEKSYMLSGKPQAGLPQLAPDHSALVKSGTLISAEEIPGPGKTISPEIDRGKSALVLWLLTVTLPLFVLLVGWGIRYFGAARRGMDQELKGLLEEVDKAMLSSLKSDCAKLLYDLSPPEPRDPDPLKLESMLSSLKASGNLPHCPWYLKVELEPDHALVMAKVLLQLARRADPALQSGIALLLRSLSRLVDEPPAAGADLNDIAAWEQWWDKVADKEEDLLLTKEAQEFSERLEQRAGEVRTEGRMDLQKRIVEAIGDIRLEEGGEAFFITRDPQGGLLHVRGDILERRGEEILIRTTTVLAIEDLLFDSAALGILSRFRNLVAGEMLASLKLLYNVIEVKSMAEGLCEIRVRGIAQLDETDQRLATELIANLS